MTEVSRNVDIFFFIYLLLALEIVFTDLFDPFSLFLPSLYTIIMNFSTLNFGQLLHLLDNEELKNIIRNFEKKKKKIISAQ